MIFANEWHLFTDQGLAAVLGAVAGVAGTGATSLLAARWARRQAGARLTAQREHFQAQLAAQRQEFEEQGYAEHVRSRRDPRSHAYAEFAAKSCSVQHVVRKANGAAECGDVNAVCSIFEAELAALEDLRSCAALLAVQGPQSVFQAAREAADAVYDWWISVIRWIECASGQGNQSSSRLSEGWEERLAAALREFTSASSSALNDEGVRYSCREA